MYSEWADFWFPHTGHAKLKPSYLIITDHHRIQKIGEQVDHVKSPQNSRNNVLKISPRIDRQLGL